MTAQPLGGHGQVVGGSAFRSAGQVRVADHSVEPGMALLALREQQQMITSGRGDAGGRVRWRR
ncbi:hypothetical protein [Catellatospora sp. NPDC049133]|jgi:hypothetical protein|uniref:hypothetical protein n=1 Tax=Catellatospora sp. NPDC049133 TaxID=3155499 RepID=UPI0033C7143F